MYADVLFHATLLSVGIELALLLLYLLFRRWRAEIQIGYIAASLVFSVAALVFLSHVEGFDLDSVEARALAFVEPLREVYHAAAWLSLALGVVETAAWVATVLFGPLAAKVAVVAGLAQSVADATTQAVSVPVALGMLFAILARVGRDVVPPVLTGVCVALPFRRARSVGLALAGVVAVFTLVLPVAASVLAPLEVEMPSTPVPENWGAALIEVVDSRGSHLPYALVVIQGTAAWNLSDCCCCRLFNLTPPANQTLLFTIQMNQFGKRLVLLPWGTYRVVAVVFDWFNFTEFQAESFTVSGYGRLVVPETAQAPMDFGGEHSDGVLVWEGDCAHATVAVDATVYEFFNESGVYGFTFGFLKRPHRPREPTAPERVGDWGAAYEKRLRFYRFDYPYKHNASDVLEVWVFGPASIKVEEVLCCPYLKVYYEIRQVTDEGEIPYGIRWSDGGLFSYVYSQYRQWWYATKAPLVLNLTPDQVAALPPEFQAVIRALNATRPTGFFFERPPVYRVR
ncbi:MAG: hypothetical protein DRJ56_06850, partial [Thermoprotei archaeon]